MKTVLPWGFLRAGGEDKKWGQESSDSSPIFPHLPGHPDPERFTTPYLSKEQTVPILRGKGEDLTVKIKVFFLTANTEMVEDKMRHVDPEKHWLVKVVKHCKSQGQAGCPQVGGWGL